MVEKKKISKSEPPQYKETTIRGSQLNTMCCNTIVCYNILYTDTLAISPKSLYLVQTRPSWCMLPHPSTHLPSPTCTPWCC